MRTLIALTAALAACGCLGDSPEEEARDALGVGDDCDVIDGDEGPEHCAGQPCLACHRTDYHPGEASFLLAGTVYDFIDDELGSEGVIVSFVDADLNNFTVTSNATGNFMVSVEPADGPGAAPRDDGRGHTRIPFRPRFPLSVGVIEPGVLARNMRSYIWREGSCATCHGPEENRTSTGRVYVQVRE